MRVARYFLVGYGPDSYYINTHDGCRWNRFCPCSRPSFYWKDTADRRIGRGPLRLFGNNYEMLNADRIEHDGGLKSVFFVLSAVSGRRGRRLSMYALCVACRQA